MTVGPGTGPAPPTADDDASEVPAAPAGDSTPGDPSGGPGSRRPDRWHLLLGGVAVVMTLIAAALSLAVGSRDRPDGERLEVARTASALVEALLTFDHAEPDVQRDRVLALATGEFASQFEDAYDSFLRTFITESRTTSAARITDVFVGEIAGDRAEAIVVFDQILTDASGARSAVDQYVRLSLVRTPDGWRVDGLTNLNFAQTIDSRDLSGILSEPGTSGAPSTTTPEAEPAG